MVRLILSAADMTVCYDPSDSTACCKHLSTSSTLAATQLLATAQQLTAGSQHNPHSAVRCLLQALVYKQHTCSHSASCNSTAAHSWITAQPSLCSQVLAAGTCLQAAHLQPLSSLQQHSSSQLDHSTTLTLQSGACCRHLSTSSTLAATQLLATAQQLTAGSQHNPHSAVRCLLQALVYSSNLQPLSSLQQHSSSQLDHSTTLTLQSGACCRHLSTVVTCNRNCSVC